MGGKKVFINNFVNIDIRDWKFMKARNQRLDLDSHSGSGKISILLPRFLIYISSQDIYETW